MGQEKLSPIAIVGIGCRFPGDVHSPQDLWRLLVDGTNTWTHVPADRFTEHAFLHPDPDDPNGSHNHPGGHFLTQDVREFDNVFFNISPQEAAAMDPQQRILLETVYEALESGGQLQENYQGSTTSVHTAMFIRDYDHNMFKDPLNIPRHQVLGTGEAILAARISHVFDLHGPAMTLDTGCSGGLVAIHQACQSLRLCESDMAIAGAANLILSPDHQIGMSNLHMLGSEGKSYPFDSRGAGYGRGEGIAAFVLKRLDDAIASRDPIRGVILGSLLNQDGRTTSGITAPSGAAQAALQARLYKKLELDPQSVAYVEAHGTGTIVGDQEEIDALADTFCKGRTAPLYVGSIKSNIGHLESTSGLAGLAKSVLVLEHGQIPGNADFVNAKPDLQLQRRNITVPAKTIAWPLSTSPRVSVNSFGYGGTNAHMVLESAPKQLQDSTDSVEDLPRLYVLSAKSKVSLKDSLSQYEVFTSTTDTPFSSSSLSYTLCNRRNHFSWRFSCVASSANELSQQLTAATLPQASSTSTKDVPINFVFTGQGAQWSGMARELLSLKDLPGFAASIHKSREILTNLGASWDLVTEILRSEAESRINSAELAQPATTAIQLALVDLLAHIGVRPSAVIGHSSGEIAASYAAGYVSHQTALHVSYYRGITPAIAQKNGCPKGSMLAVGLGEDGMAEYYARITKGNISTACVNSPESTTVSGDADAIDELASILKSEGIFCRKLKVNVAYHSKHMQVAAKEYGDLIRLADVEPRQGSAEFYSTVTGKAKCTNFDSQYWVDNLVTKVSFQQGVNALCRMQNASRQIYIEIGPHNALAGPIKQCIEAMPNTIEFDYTSPLRRGVNSVRSLLEVLGKLFELGKQIDLSILSDLDPSMKDAQVLHNLPRYSWEHSTKHWYESRISRNHRLRKHPYHDLVGIPSTESTSIEPRWRHMISLATLPWLADHVVDEVTVFPGSGYLCMAIEAATQLARDRHPERRISRVVLNDAEFLKALLVPSSPGRLETQLSFTPVQSRAVDSNSMSYHFRVAAFSHDELWEEHCRGRATVHFTSESNHEVFRPWQDCDYLTKTLAKEEVYQQMASHGNTYGPTFAGVSKISVGEEKSLATVMVPDIAQIMPAQHMQPHTIHPTTLDIIMHSSLPLATQKLGVGSIMPIRVEELIVSTEMNSIPGTIFSAHAAATSTKDGNITMDIDVSEGRSPSCSLSISGVELRLLATPSLEQKPVDESPNLCWEVEWKPDVDFIDLKRYANEEHEGRLDKVTLLNQLASFYVKRYVHQYSDNQHAVVENHKDLHQWMMDYAAKEGLDNFTARITGPSAEENEDVDVQMVARTGGSLSDIVTGREDALQLAIEDDLLFKVYQSNLSVPSYKLMAQYVKELCFKKSRLRILEIGAGTGGATKPFLQAMKDSGSTPELYHFTDVSTGFFERAKSTFPEGFIEFRRLDIEQDPLPQGFEASSYDVILALNCLHVCSRIQNTLHNVRSLLKPDGRLVLLEITEPQPFLHITSGTLTGYWKGREDRRSQGPFMNVYRWKEELENASLTMQVELQDSKSAHVHSLMIVRHQDRPNLKITDTVNIVPVGNSEECLAPKLLTALAEKGLHAKMADFDQILHDQSIAIILDDGHCPLLSHVTPETFRRICQILTSQSRVLWVSASNDNNSRFNPAKHLVTGLARSAYAENADLRFVTVDVQQDTHRDLQKTLDLLSKCLDRSFLKPGEYEREYVLRDDSMLIPRVLPSKELNGWVYESQQAPEESNCDFSSHSLVLSQESLLHPIFKKVVASPLGHNEIEIHVKAVGASLSSQYVEYSGTVISVGANVDGYEAGDRVMAVDTAPCASRPRIIADHVQRIPKEVSFTTAAGLPLALMAASFSMDSLGGSLKKAILLQGINSTVVGQALLMLSRVNYTEVYAIASNASEEKLLTQNFQLCPNNIIQLRSLRARKPVLPKRELAFDAIIVCDSLETPSHITSLLKPFGSLVIAKSETEQTDSSTNRFQLLPNVTIRTCDIEALLDSRPDELAKLLGIAAEWIHQFPSASLLPTIKPISQIRDVLTQQQLHSPEKRVVFEVGEDSMVPVSAVKDTNFSLPSQGTYIVAGGLGDLGRSTIAHLARHGAQHIVTFSRRKPSCEIRSRIEDMVAALSSDCRVHYIQCDIGIEEKVKAAATEIRNLGLPAVKGIVQSAMVLQDRTLEHMTSQDFQVPLETKMRGTLNLKSAFETKALDFFVMLSSAASVLGTSGQGNYSAGNAFQDALASFSESSSTHYLAFNPGIIEGAEVTKDTESQIQARYGFVPIPRSDLEKMLQYLLSPTARADRCSMIVAGFNSRSLPNARSINGNAQSPMFMHARDVEAIQAKQEVKVTTKSFKDVLASGSAEDVLAFAIESIALKLSNLIGAGGEAMDLDKPIYDFGVDSLIAVELRNWIKREFESSLQSLEILDETSISSLAKKVLERSTAM